VRQKAGGLVSSDVVGPICESGGLFLSGPSLPKVGQGDCLARDAGADGSVMGSKLQYPAVAAEVLVNGSKTALVRNAKRIGTFGRASRPPMAALTRKFQ